MLRSIAEFFKNIWRAQWLAVEVLMLKEKYREAQFEAWNFESTIWSAK